MCSHMVCVCVCVEHTSLWGPEIEFSGPPPQLVSTLCVEADLSLNRELPVSADPPCVSIVGGPPHLPAGQDSVFTLVWQACHLLSHLPIPGLLF